METLGKFPAIASFLAGIATFISPCILPLIPAYLTFITGESIDELTHSEGSYKRATADALFFIAGFTLVFVLLGASASYLGSLMSDKRDYLRWAGGILVIVFGLHTAGLLRMNFLYHTRKLAMGRVQWGYLEPFFVGVAFAVGWTPCVGPILSSILILASTQDTVRQGVLLLLVYSLGLGVPFLLTALFVEWALRVFNKIKKYYRQIEIVSGGILVVVGILIITDSFKMITGYLLDIFMQ
jgi:cytochrome c-type biogenesis protein